MYTNRSSWGRVFGLACFLAFLLIGFSPIMEFFYKIGLFPAVTEEEVVARLKRDSADIEGVTCQKNVAGWEYVCDYRGQSSPLDRQTFKLPRRHSHLVDGAHR